MAVLAAFNPPSGHIADIGQGGCQPALIYHREPPSARPQDQRRPVIAALERRALIAGGFVEALFVGSQILKGVEWRNFSFDNWQNPQLRVAALGLPPFGQGFASLVDLAHLEVVIIATAPVPSIVAG